MADYYFENDSPPRQHARTPRRSSTGKDLKRVEEEDIVQGRVFWLPPKEELPARAVRRAHGKGAVEEGIYNHPVVVISRPADDSQTIHFHIITSFQGKRLHEIYSKSNEFHASRRSWYLPISPSPAHPDASSKKSRKRFPTLDLASSATLRWDSYVNLRHVYKIDWRELRAYSNPDTPEQDVYRFDKESMIKMLAKSKVLTGYEAGSQYQASPVPLRTRQLPFQNRRVPPVQINVRPSDEMVNRYVEPPSPKSDTDTASIVSSEYSGLSPILQSDFGGATTEDQHYTPRPPREPDKTESRWAFLKRVLRSILVWPIQLLKSVRDRLLSRERSHSERRRTGGE